MATLRRRILISIVLILGLVAYATPRVHAGSMYSVSATLTSPNTGAVGELFGSSVAISDNGRSIVGAPTATASGISEAGEAFLFDSSGNILQAFQDPTPVTGEHFGSSVAISNKGNIIVGAPDKPNFPHPGFVFLFDASGSLLQVFLDPSSQHEHFGVSVAVTTNGRSILVGAPGFLDLPGEAFLFDTSGNLLQTFAAGGGPIQFGASVSISSDANSILVGAPSGIVSGNATGTAYLFDSSGNLVQSFNDPDTQADEEFGTSVSISTHSPHNQQTLIVGAPQATVGSPGCTCASGKAFLFDTSGNLLQTFLGTIVGGRLGSSVSITGTGSIILVGEPGRHEFGKAYLFDPSGTLIQSFVGGVGPAAFGLSVDVSTTGNRIVVGAAFAEVPLGSGPTEGLTVVFARAGGPGTPP